MKRIGLASVSVALFGISAALLLACGEASDSTSAFNGGGAADASRAGSSSSSGGMAREAPTYNAGAPGGSSGSTSSSSSSSSGGGSSGAAPTSPITGVPSEGTITGPQAQSGLLTAGVWDDNLNIEFFKGYLDGNAYAAAAPSFTIAERDAAAKKWLQRTGSTELDIAFLVDTTGSMGDELKYLQAEIDGITQAIATKFPLTKPRYALVVYKDKGDAYVTRSFDFGTKDSFRQNLLEQTVGGGGDVPEAVPEGLTAAMALGWRTGKVSRMTFWVADASHHPGTEGTVRQQIDAAVAKDVHLYPIAASGTDPLAELTMRTAAQMTGGRYVFLTDDSGIGNSHAEPHIPCYVVTRLDGAVIRMVESEMTGTHVAPLASEVIRTVGDPKGGTCVTASKGNVSIY